MGLVPSWETLSSEYYLIMFVIMMILVQVYLVATFAVAPKRFESFEALDLTLTRCPENKAQFMTAIGSSFSTHLCNILHIDLY